MVRPIKIEKDDVSPLTLVKGVNTRFNVWPDTLGSETVRMGVCYHEADMDDLPFSGNIEEAFYVAKGTIKVVWEGDGGKEEETVVREGEQIFLPKGLRFKLRATGEPAINVFAAGIPVSPTISEARVKAAARLRSKLETAPASTGRV